MSWEFDPAERTEDVKDRTKLLWGLVLVGFVVMAALLAVTTRQGAVAQSRAYVKHIYVPFEFGSPEDRDRALQLTADVRQRIVSGDLEFEEAARLYSSEEGSADRGGHLGWTLRDEFADGKAKEFVWNGPIGELSAVLESRGGFHLIFVEKRELSAQDEYERDLHRRVIQDVSETPAN